MVQISVAIAAIVILGAANIGMKNAYDPGRSKDISVVTAQFIPDTMPELREWRWPPGGHYLIVIRNTGKTPMEVTDILLDEVSVVNRLTTHGDLKATSIWHGEHLTKPSAPTRTLMDAGEPIWYKIRPTSVAPGGLGFLLIRTRLSPSHPVEVRIADNRGNLCTAVVKPQEPKVRIAYVGFGANCEQMVIFARKLTPEDLTFDSVYLNEIDITAQCRFASPDFWHDLGILTVALDTPLKEGVTSSVAAHHKTGRRDCGHGQGKEGLLSGWGLRLEFQGGDSR